MEIYQVTYKFHKKTNNAARAIIKRLSFERWFNIIFNKNPNKPPNIITPMLVMIGMIIDATFIAKPLADATAIEMAIL